jgi:hypothetical protein
MIAIEYVESQSSGNVRYLFDAVVVPIAFLRNAGSCTVL